MQTHTHTHTQIDPAKLNCENNSWIVYQLLNYTPTSYMVVSVAIWLLLVITNNLKGTHRGLPELGTPPTWCRSISVALGNWWAVRTWTSSWKHAVSEWYTGQWHLKWTQLSTIKQDGSDTLEIATRTPLKKQEMCFKVDEVFKGNIPWEKSDREMKASWEDEKLVIRMMDDVDGSEPVFARYIDGEQLVLAQSKKGVESKRYFQRITQTKERN